MRVFTSESETKKHVWCNTDSERITLQIWGQIKFYSIVFEANMIKFDISFVLQKRFMMWQVIELINRNYAVIIDASLAAYCGYPKSCCFLLICLFVCSAITIGKSIRLACNQIGILVKHPYLSYIFSLFLNLVAWFQKVYTISFHAVMLPMGIQTL